MTDGKLLGYRHKYQSPFILDTYDNYRYNKLKNVRTKESQARDDMHTYMYTRFPYTQSLKPV